MVLVRALVALVANAMSPLSGTLPFAVVEHPGTSMELLLTAILDKLECIIPCSVLMLLMFMISISRSPLLVLPTATTWAGVQMSSRMFPIPVVLLVRPVATLVLVVTTLMSQCAASVLPTARPVSVVLAVTAEISAMLTSSVVLAVVIWCGPPRTPVRVIPVDGLVSVISVFMLCTSIGS